MISKNQNGFNLIGILLIMVVIGVVGFAGYKVFLAKDKGDYSSMAQKPETDQSTKIGAGDNCQPPAPVAKAEAFSHAPFEIDKIRLVTNGKDEGYDSRFVYVFIDTAKADKTEIFAPADGKLYMIQRKNYIRDGVKVNDYDFFFAADCKTVYRLNHITDPRDDLKAAYVAGDESSGDYANGGANIPERTVPKNAVVVKAGESLGFTSGTPLARNFDFAAAVAESDGGDKLAVCPFNIFEEPLKTQLLKLLGPKNGKPTPGYECNIESKLF